MEDLQGKRVSPATVGRVIRDFIKASGPDVTKGALDREMTSRGFKLAHYNTYALNYRRYYSVAPPTPAPLQQLALKQEMAVAVVPEVFPWADFMKMVLMVRDVGGVDKARRYLDLIEANERKAGRLP